MSHDHINSLDGLEWHAQLLPPQGLLQQLQVHLGHMLDANLLGQKGWGGKEGREGKKVREGRERAGEREGGRRREGMEKEGRDGGRREEGGGEGGRKVERGEREEEGWDGEGR